MPTLYNPILARRSRDWLASIALSLATLLVGAAWIRSNQAGSAPLASTNHLYWYISDVRGEATDADLILEGTVTEVHPAQWTTPDGEAPDQLNPLALLDPNVVLDEQKLPNGDVKLGDLYAETGIPDIQLRTPVTLAIDTVYKGDNVPDSLLFTFPGGGDGTNTVTFEESGPELQPGMCIVIFLSAAPPNAGPWSKISPWYPGAYFAVHGDTLESPLLTLERSVFLSQLAESGLDPDLSELPQ